MPSKRPQLNVRLREDELALVARLARRLEGETGIPMSQADVIRAGLHELRKRYPDEQPAKAEPAEHREPGPKEQSKPKTVLAAAQETTNEQTGQPSRLKVRQRKNGK
jgi:hypothetical protein